MAINFDIVNFPVGSPATRADVQKYFANLEAGVDVGDQPPEVALPSTYTLKNLTDNVFGEFLVFEFISGSGDFTYSGNEITGGTVTQLNVYSGVKSGVNINNRVLRAELTNLNWNAADLYNAVVNGDAAAFNAIFYEQDSFVYSGDIGADSFTGSIFADKINGEQGNDILFGDKGNDILNGGAGADKIAGGLDIDTADYFGSAAGVTIDLTKQGIFDPAKNVISKATAQKGGDAQGDLLSGIENIIGSDSNDTFTANFDANEFDGGNGKDTVSYTSSTGKVTANLMSGEGKGSFAEADKYTAIENLVGSKFDDVLTGDGSDNTLDGGAGDDTLAGLGGADQVIGGANGASGDTVDYSASGDGIQINLLQQSTKLDVKTGLLVGGVTQIGGDAEGDKLFGVENVIGTGKADTITGDAKNNIIEGGADADTLDGGLGIDTLSYASSDFRVRVTLGEVITGVSAVTVSNDAGGHDDGDDAKNFENLTGSAFNDSLTGNALANVLKGGDGDDSLRGNGGNDILDGGDGVDLADFGGAASAVTVNLQTGKATGGDGADTLISIEKVLASLHNDVITGDAGNNVLIGNSGNDTLIGGAGDDQLDGGVGIDLLNGGAGADILDGGVALGPDTATYADSKAGITANLTTGAGEGGDAEGDTYTSIENLIGSKFNDVLVGSADDNTLDGGAGDDILAGRGGADQLIGGANSAIIGDTADYSASASKITVNLTQQATKLDAKTSQLVGGAAQTGGDAEGDKLFGVENVVGSSSDDTITGDAKSNVIEGAAGTDTLDGGLGVDTVNYANSNAKITVYLNGVNFADNISGGHADGDLIKGFENLIGSDFDDEIGGDAGNNVLEGRGGNDYINGFVGNDILLGGDGDDELDGSLGIDTLFGGDGNDKLIGGAGADKLAGGLGVDTADYSGSSAAVTIDLTKQGIYDSIKNVITKATAQKGGDATGDLLSGIENVIGSDFNDLFIANGDINKFDGGDSKDTVSYAASLVGVTSDLATPANNSGDATGDIYISVENLTGSAKNDILVGDAGDNTLDGGAGDDVLTGGAGPDQLIGGTNNTKGGEFGDAANYVNSAVAVTVNLNQQATKLDTKTGLLTGGTAQKGGDAEGDLLFGIENLVGSAHDDVLTGNTAINFLTGGDGHDTIDGGAGNDVLGGGQGDDLLIGGAGADTITGHGGIDTVSYAGSKAAVTVKLGLNDDEGQLGVGGDAAGDKISGVENLIGSNFNDKLTGGDQDNILTGGKGNDTLDGGDGGDTFVYNAGDGLDTIDNFERNNDLIDLSSMDGVGFDALDLQQVGDHTVIVFDATNKITLTNIDKNDLEASDFKFANAAPNDITLAPDNIDENNAADTLIGTLSATDADDASGFTFTLTDDADGRFEIKNGNELYAVDPLNAEDASSIGIKVEVTDSKGAKYEESLTVNVNDQNEFTPDITSNGGGGVANLAVNENTTAVTTVTATDGDASAAIKYTITGGVDQNLFTIDENTGVLTFKTPQDREAPADSGVDGTYTVIVTASDGTKSDTQTVNVGVHDVDEFSPIITSGGGGATASYQVDENTTSVATIAASDGDVSANVQYSITGGSDAALFNIDASTGELTFKSAPNFEDAKDDGADNEYEVIVKASDSGKFDTQTINVVVKDVNEFTPVITSDGGGALANLAINENTTAVTTVAATDGDGSATIKYSLVGGVDQLLFDIDENTGALTFKNPQDREAPADSGADGTYTVIVSASDGTTSDTQTINVGVHDVDEFDATTPSDTDAAANAVDENAANGTAVGITAFSEDEDVSSNTITYSLTDDANGAFEIDANTGVVTVADGSKINREANSSPNISVKATSTDGSSQSESFTIVVNDVDEFDVSTPVDSDITPNQVAENAVNGTWSGITAFALDNDSTNNAVTYSLTNDAGGAFKIDAAGDITVADGSKIDREANASLDVTVKATSLDGSFATKTFTIAINDVDEFDPAITSEGGGNDAAVSIDENVGLATTVVVADADATADIVYSISGGLDAALFAIDTDTGALTFKSAPDFEDPSDADFDNVYEVEVTATSGAKSDTQTIKVTVDDVEEAPEFTTGNFTVGENSFEAGTVDAFDPDDASGITFSIDGGDDAALFTIDPNTGALSFAGNPDFESPSDLDIDNVYKVTVKASDGTLDKTQDVEVTVTNVNEAPTKIELDNTAVDEMSAIGTVVGTLSATDQDAGDQNQEYFTYTLVDDAGGRFALDGNKVVVNGDIDYETNLDGIEIQVQVQDKTGAIFGQTIVIDVNDLDEVTAPDGYIAGATIFSDTDFDFEQDFNETFVTSDQFGNFNLASGAAPIVLTGGTDIATGKAFSGFMAAPVGATVISPLTTQVQVLLEFQGFNYGTEADANTAVLNAFGLNSGIGLLSQYDQIAATINGDPNAAAAAKQATRLQEMLAMAVPVLMALGAVSERDMQLELLKLIGNDITSNEPLTFSAARVEFYLDFVNTTLLGAQPEDDQAIERGAAEVIAAILAKMDDLNTTGSQLLADLAEIAIVASNAAAALGTANAGNIASIESDYTGANLDAKIAGEDGNSENVLGIAGDDVLTGTTGGDFLDGGAGNDVLNGGDGNDILVGGEGNDTLNGGGGKDVMIGGSGDDMIDGGEWYTAYDNAGSGDFDRVSYAGASSAVTVDLSIKGTPQNTGGGGNDSIIHVEGVIGSAHNDVLKGGANDFIESFRGGAGDDTINGGGSGLDRAEYGDGTAGIAVDLGAGTVNGVAAGLGTDTLVGVEEIFGTAFDDVFDASGFTASTDSSPSANTGDASGTFNSFHGGAGDDTIIGNGDTRIDYAQATHGVFVDLTNRDVDANTGKVYGGDGVGTDTFSGVKRVRGSMFDDVLLGGQKEYGAPGQAEFFMGFGGNDYIDGGSGFDYVQYAVAAFVLDGIKAEEHHTANAGDYEGKTFGIIVNLGEGIVYGDAKSFGTDVLSEVEGVVGSLLADLYDATGFGSTSTNKQSQGVIINEFDGGAGDDIIIGNGSTRVSYRSSTQGVSVDLLSGVVAGNESVGKDTLVGGISSIRGSDFNDTLKGTNSGGPEVFDGQGGDDTIDGRGGFDRATYNQDNEVTKGITVTLTTTGNFQSGGTLTGAVTGNTAEVGDDVLLSIESVTGTNFDDVLNIVGVSASNFGGLEFEGAGGNDSITGLFATGTFTRISYSTATDGVIVAFASNAGNANANSGTATGNDSVGSDTFANVRDVRGSNYDDVINGRTLVGTSGNIDNNVFQGGAGGNDIIEGGLGNDTIWGGDADTANGGERYDGISANGFDDIDWASYANANNGVTVTLGTGTAAGSATGANIGTDVLNNIEAVAGSAFADILNGGDNFFEIFRGNGGADAINGGGGTDVSDYRNSGAAITVDLAGGNVTGGAGSDTLTGVEGVFGSAHADAYAATGFSGSSTNAGSNGTSNFFRGGGGNDVIIGNGNTRIEYVDGTAGITVDLGVASVDGSAAGLGVDDISGGGINQVRGTAFDDELIGTDLVGTNLFEAFIGGGGDDLINGKGGFDRAQYHLDGNISVGINVQLALGIVTGDENLTGTDTLQSVEGITGSILDDIYDARGFGPGSTNAGSNGTFNEFEGHAGNDTIYGNGNTRLAFYNAQGNVSIDLEAGTVTGGNSVGTDTIMGGVRSVRGSSFNDGITGDSKNNVLEGQDGDDVIRGNGGNDTLSGGLGHDTFLFYGFGHGADVITDFVTGPGLNDRVVFTYSMFDNFADFQDSLTQVGADVVLSVGESDSVTFRNTNVGDFHQDDFHLVLI